eukprot:CAMPEP_0174250672 /NCGR_PEP_ID=MMETSP0439-20130205/775_1 /TAXON_ID=0 /ORGANISM="Stereomyxa ramosa, Strain Chinc5" /LENGTH=163 /DNA_ID=CAMNT_0015330803 /DNA_START=31 /DNA_END=522 /DNA_ORIENTATION=-
MNPKCPRCNKTVYPVEAIKGANKTWHKGCFRCLSCQCTLNLKTFKAHQGEIYCKVHYPPSVTEVKTFGNDRSADTGEFSSTAGSSTADTSGAGGQVRQSDTGEYGAAPGGGYDQGGYGGGAGYDQGGYDQGGYDQGGYDQGGYDQGGYEEGYYEEGYYEEGGY